MSVKDIKAKYPVGTRIKIIFSDDPFHPIPEGMLGTVTGVDDIGTVHMKWDNGSTLGLIVGDDIFEIVQ